MKPYATLDDKFLTGHGLVACVLDLARQRQINIDKLLRGTGIFQEDIFKSGYHLSLSQLLRLLAQFQCLQPGDDGAFQLGHRLFPDVSAAANALVFCRNPRQALRLLDSYRLQLAPLLFGCRYEHNDYCHIVLNDAVGMPDTLFRFVVEVYCCALVAAFRFLLGQRVTLCFEFPYPQPAYIAEYQEHLGLRLAFNRPALRICIEQHWLSQPLLQSSGTRRQLALSQARTERVPYKMTFIEAVSRCLLVNRNSTLTDIAEYFDMSPATFKRKLKQHNVRFQQLQDQVNLQQALYMLTVKGWSNETVAKQLAFHDIPNFRRAFKRWTGFTPSEAKQLLPV